MNLPDRLDLIQRFYEWIILDPDFVRSLHKNPFNTWSPTTSQQLLISEIVSACERDGYRVPTDVTTASGMTIALWLAGLMHNIDPCRYGPVKAEVNNPTKK